MTDMSSVRVKVTTNLEELNSILNTALTKCKEFSDALEKISGFELELKPELVRPVIVKEDE